MATQEEVEMVRLLTGERIPTGEDETSTNFTDSEIEAMWAIGLTLDATLAMVWAAKAGIYVDAIDISENGSDRNLSQMYDHCLKQLQYYSERADKAMDEVVASLRAVGHAFGPYEGDEPYTTAHMLYRQSRYDDWSTRTYPTKRFGPVG